MEREEDWLWREGKQVKKPELKFEVSNEGIEGSSHCYFYSPKCGKCGYPVSTRSTKDYQICGTVKGLMIVFQCDHCKLKWAMSTYLTNKNVKNMSSKQGAATAK
jgi:hypothetical protein